MDRTFFALYSAAFALSFAALGLAIAFDPEALACELHSLEGVPHYLLAASGC